MPHVTIFGSLNYDLVVVTARVPNGGETIHCDSFATHCGGKGANQALAVRRLSEEATGVRMVGRVGQDGFGQQLKAGLNEAGADVSFVTEVPGESGIAVIIVERSGENRILVNAGANGTFKPEDVNIDMFTTANGSLTDYLVLQNELPGSVVLAAIELAFQNGIKIVYNPSPMDVSLIVPEIMSKISYLLVNESELAQMLGQPIRGDVGTNRMALLQRVAAVHEKCGFKGTAVVTLGAHGSIYSVYDGPAGFVEAFKAPEVVDTTGAGDSFLGAFVGAIADNKDVPSAVRWGSAAGCLAVGKKGAAESIPTIEETRQLENRLLA